MPKSKPRTPGGYKERDRLTVKSRKLRRRGLIKNLVGRSRGQADVRREYQHEIWPTYQLAKRLVPKGHVTPIVWGDRLFLAGVMGTKRVHLALLMNAIEAVKPSRVLEVGSGVGLNILVLGARFPDIEFVGGELTPVGVDATNAVAAKGIPDSMAAFSPQPLSQSVGALENVRALEADAGDRGQVLPRKRQAHKAFRAGEPQRHVAVAEHGVGAVRGAKKHHVAGEQIHRLDPPSHQGFGGRREPQADRECNAQGQRSVGAKPIRTGNKGIHYTPHEQSDDRDAAQHPQRCGPGTPRGPRVPNGGSILGHADRFAMDAGHPLLGIGGRRHPDQGKGQSDELAIPAKVRRGDCGANPITAEHGPHHRPGRIECFGPEKHPAHGHRHECQNPTHRSWQSHAHRAPQMIDDKQHPM